MVTEAEIRKAFEGVMGFEIARLCDVGRIEEYTGELFAPIAQDLFRRIHDAPPSVSTHRETHAG